MQLRTCSVQAGLPRVNRLRSLRAPPAAPTSHALTALYHTLESMPMLLHAAGHQPVISD